MRWLDTRASWDWFMQCWEQLFRLVGLTSEDVLAFPFSFGPFIGFWAAFEGGQRMGNRILAMGGMSSEARLQMILDLEATVVCCTPTYAMRLADIAEQSGLPLAQSAVRMLIVAGEPGGAIPAIRQRLESVWGARVCDHWGMTDIGPLGMEPWDGPGGLLVLETECIAEILDSQSLQPVQPGELGELVITNLGRWGQPVIRYRTGDLVRAATTPCPSGTSLLRLEGGILGRSDDMITIRGNNLFPSSLEAVIRDFPDVAEYRITVVTRRAMPHVKIEVEPVESIARCVEHRQALLTALSRAVKDRLSFQAELEAVPVGALPRFEMKGRRFHRETESM
jgi:phenylacetate-CoA ligase